MRVLEAYLVSPGVNAILGVISFPSGPTALSMHIVASMVVIMIHRVVSARWRPGQILMTRVCKLQIDQVIVFRTCDRTQIAPMVEVRRYRLLTLAQNAWG